MSKSIHKQVTLPSAPDHKRDDAPLPETIGPYKIETLLAKGGTSLLYLGLHPKTRKASVVKVLSPSYINHPEMADHFLNEAKIIALADHPNIVKLYDYGKWEGGLFTAMEFIRGVSLRQFLVQQSFSLKRCIDILLQVSYALLHLHTHGVIHRDLKPENILIAEDGEVKVIDFGIAQLHEDEETPPIKSNIVGTPSYMSPEQKADPQSVTFASDIYSLGIIAYELILGKLSHGQINLTLLPKGIQPIIAKALAISPEERYTDIVPFITDLSNYTKSPLIRKDRPGGDQVLELMEELSQADQALSHFEKPNWAPFEIGIARHTQSHPLGLYSDLFHFANNTYGLLIAYPQEPSITSLIPNAVFHGMIKTLVHPHITTDTPFDPADFASSLNTLVFQDKLQATFNLHLLKLIPYEDTLVYLSCGHDAPLFHTPAGSNTPRTIHSEAPAIGADANSTFETSSDTLQDGDTLLFHPFPADPYQAALTKALTSHTLLAPARLAETTLEAALSTEPPRAPLSLAIYRLA